MQAKELQMSTVEQVEKWLECHIDKGMFSDERAVSYPPTGQYRKSVFVPVGAVRGILGGRGKVRVGLVCRDGKLMAVLPSSRKDIVVVSEGDVSE